MNAIALHPRIAALQLRLRARSHSLLRCRLEALRLRLGRRTSAQASGRGSITAGIAPIERVMRRSAFHLSRHFAAHFSLQALLAAGITRQHTERIDWRQSQARLNPALTPRPLERVLATQHVLRERLLLRLTRTALPSVASRVSHSTRVEIRHASPRPQLTMVRSQAAVAAEARNASQPSVPVAAPGRPASAFAGPASAAPPLVLPPQEMSRLTDHVIRQLDHRVLSWQERTGRA